MKKFLLILAALSVPALIYAAISGTAHDFSSAGNNLGTTACSGCHKPHNVGTLIPLWNDANQFDDVVYAAYSSPTDALNATPSSTIGDISKACMACHDGMVEATSTNLTTLYSPKSTITTGLKLDYTNNASGQHPISIVYTQGVNTSLKALATVKSAGFKFYGTTNDKLECATCHDPHGKDDGNGSNYPDFLRASAATLCQSCHNN
ncbi:MAG: cytochrome c3 family protein [Calditerrivibrio sp.]|nr:cytochrome c3 family protein [Calditerrivibrio sp.]